MPQFNFAMPILPGKTDAWRKAIAEMKGPRASEYRESRKKIGINREFVCFQHTPHGDFVVVHMDAKDPASVMPKVLGATSGFDKWFLDTVLVGTHGLDPKGPPPPLTEVALDFKG